jgi:GT2 family glycosyltransferase
LKTVIFHKPFAPSLSLTSNPLITVVVVNWNRRDLLRACLRSLYAQKMAEAVEIIVVDNGSTDGSAATVRSEFPQAQIIENKHNLGFCEANNQGIRAARGAYVALLNNDAEADTGWLAALASGMEEARVGMVASKIVVHEHPERIDKVGHLIYPDGQNRGRGAGELDQGQYDQREEVLWPDGCAAMYRKAMLEEIGGFEEEFFAYADDAELGLRARIAGWDCLYVPAARVRHHRGQTLGVASVRRLALIERNRILMVAKLFPWRWVAAAPFYFLLRLAAGAVAALRHQGETKHYPGMSGKWRLAQGILQGNWQAFWMLPRMLKKRKEVDRFRRRSDAEIIALLQRHRISLRELSTQAN